MSPDAIGDHPTTNHTLLGFCAPPANSGNASGCELLAYPTTNEGLLSLDNQFCQYNFLALRHPNQTKARYPLVAKVRPSRHLHAKDQCVREFGVLSSTDRASWRRKESHLGARPDLDSRWHISSIVGRCLVAACSPYFNRSWSSPRTENRTGLANCNVRHRGGQVVATGRWLHTVWAAHRRRITDVNKKHEKSSRLGPRARPGSQLDLGYIVSTIV